MPVMMVRERAGEWVVVLEKMGVGERVQVVEMVETLLGVYGAA